jgi:heme-degrading monooxygenase HmoA
MVVTIFRSRLKPGADAEYTEWATRISALAKTMPGYISHKVFVAEDGERCTLVEFENEEAQRGWSANLQHVDAKKKGRLDFYAEYKLQVCRIERESSFVAPHRTRAEA